MDTHHAKNRTNVYRKNMRYLLPLLVVCYLFAFIDRTIVGFAWLEMEADVGLSAAAFGLGAGLFFISYAFCEVPSNLLMLKFGPKIWFSRILITWGIITILMAFVQGPWSFYALRFLLGVAEAGFYPGIIYFITKWFPPSRCGQVIGIFFLANPLALVIGSPLSGLIMQMDGLYQLAGWQWLFILMGLPPVLLSLIVLRSLPNTPQQAHWLNDDERSQIASDIEQEQQQNGVNDAAGQQHHPLRVMKDRRIMMLIAFLMCYPIVGYGLMLWLPSIINKFSTSVMMTGLLSALPWLAAAVAVIVVPRSAARHNTPFLHIGVTLALSVAGLILSVVFNDPLWRMLALCLAAFGIFAGQPIFWSFPARLLKGTDAAVGIAWINAFGIVGGFIGPYGFGVVAQLTGSNENGLVWFIGWGIYGLLMLYPLRRMMRRQRGMSGEAPAVPHHL